MDLRLLLPFLFLSRLWTAALTQTTTTEEPVTEIIDLNVPNYPDDFMNESEHDRPSPTNPVSHVISSPPTGKADGRVASFPQDQSLFFCSCDLTFPTCDVDCCCDPDCDASQKRVFSGCKEIRSRTAPSVDRRCQQIRHFFRDNSNVMRTESDSDSYFCLVRENLKERHFYKDSPAVESESGFENAHNLGYSWTPTTQPSFPHEMKAGAIMKMIQRPDNTLRSWDLPCSLLTGWCDSLCPVTYLIGQSWSCLQPISTSACTLNQFLNARTYHRGMRVLRTLGLVNGTSSQPFCIRGETCSSSNLITPKISWKLLARSPRCATDGTKVPEPTLERDGLCCNVVRHVAIKIEHSGVDGVDKIEMSLELEAANTTVPFLQQVSLNFSWTNVTSRPLERSGNPGYLSGLPIIVTSRAPSPLRSNQSLDRTRHLTVIGAKPDGECVVSKTKVRFGRDMFSRCLLNVSLPSNNSCAFLKRSVRDQMLGVERPELISSYGDPDLNDSNSWTKILLPNDVSEDPEAPLNGHCSSVPDHLDIQILYARTHTVHDPQTKVLGARFLLRTTPYVALGKQSKNAVLYLSTSVTFRRTEDATLWEYGKPPQIKGNLPSDFFYPFQMGDAAKSSPLVPFYVLLFNLHFLPFCLCNM